MKYLSFFLIALLITSCSSSKRVAQSNSKEIAQNTPQQIKSTDTTKILSSKPKIDTLVKEETVVVITQDSNKKIDSINKLTQPHQVLTKRFLAGHKLWNELLQDNVSSQGNVNYDEFYKDWQKLQAYIKFLDVNSPKKSWTKEDKLAYWINAYNAMTIDLILRHYPINSIKDIKDPWKQCYWKIGEKWYNLDEIEHQIIRKMDEPRIHFALVCAAVSCPKLYNKAFTAQSLEDDLSKLTREFLADPSKNTITENSLKLSKIFSWFTKDFKQDGSLINFLNKYTNIEISENAKKRFNDYNWDLND